MIRTYPPLSVIDTVNNGVSVHGIASVFDDDEIITVSDTISSTQFGNTGSINLVANNKYVIQQQATRGCTAAAVAMMLKDHGVEPEWYKLMISNLGTAKWMLDEIQLNGFNPIHTVGASVIYLKTKIQDNGSAIVSISSDKIGGHVIIVDAIYDYYVLLRDPYHGWQITVPLKVFEKYYDITGSVIQINSNPL